MTITPSTDGAGHVTRAAHGRSLLPSAVGSISSRNGKERYDAAADADEIRVLSRGTACDLVRARWKLFACMLVIAFVTLAILGGSGRFNTSSDAGGAGAAIDPALPNSIVFFGIGDWGRGGMPDQLAVADGMALWVERLRASSAASAAARSQEGQPQQLPAFIVNVGDSFCECQRQPRFRRAALHACTQLRSIFDDHLRAAPSIENVLRSLQIQKE